MSNSRERYQPKGFDSAPDRSFSSLIRALNTGELEPLSCAECRAHLAGLYHLRRAGGALSSEYQSAVAHLAACPDCAVDYEVLQVVLAELATETLPELATSHTFDLSFLSSHPQELQGQPPPLWQQSLTKHIWSLFTELEVRLQATRASFGPLPAPLTPSPAGAAVFRSDSGGSQPAVLVLPAPDAQLSVHLAVGPMIAGNAVVMVKLLAMPSEQPLADVRVTLRNALRQLLMGVMTRQDGTALFEQLPLGRYFIQVRYEEHVWEMPLVIVAGSPAA